MASLHSSIHKRLVSLATTVSILAAPIALAQDQAKARHVGAAAIDNSERFGSARCAGSCYLRNRLSP